MSLAVIHPLQTPYLRFDFNPSPGDVPRLTLFDDDIIKREPDPEKRFPYMPRLEFRDQDGFHRLMLRDWGCFEFLRKYPERREELSEALHLGPRSSLMVGNMNNKRNAWLIISVVQGLRSVQATMFDEEYA
jgi:hypothetical protein